MRNARYLLAGLSVSVVPALAMAQALDRDSLTMIGETATAICGEIMQSGSNRDIEIAGEVNAELKGLAKKLADAGIEGTARLDDGRYANVLRDELGEELKNARECRMKVFEKLMDRIGPATSPPPETVGGNNQPATDYPDTHGGGPSYPGYAEFAGDVMWGQFINCSVYNASYGPIRVTNINYLLQGMYGPQPVSVPCNFNCEIFSNHVQMFNGPQNNPAIASAQCSVTAFY